VGGLGVVDSLSTSLDIAAHTVVVAGSEGVEVVGTVEGNSVVGGVEAEGGSVAGHFALGNVVRGLTTEEEAITAQNGVGSECGTLKKRATISECKRTGQRIGRTLKMSRAARVWTPDCL